MALNEKDDCVQMELFLRTLHSTLSTIAQIFLKVEVQYCELFQDKHLSKRGKKKVCKNLNIL